MFSEKITSAFRKESEENFVQPKLSVLNWASIFWSLDEQRLWRSVRLYRNYR